MQTHWNRVDTREFGRNRNCAFDGFVHVYPRAMGTIHEMSLRCWCGPGARWPEDGKTVVVSHRDKRPGRRGEVSKCPE
jgi:hypothetical protein